MDDHVRSALMSDFTIDLTTTGRRSGEARRIEIWLLHTDGRLFITGTPGPRDWFANVEADAGVVVHVKQSVMADVAARASVVTDPQTRRRVFAHLSAQWYRDNSDHDALVETAPMIELHIPGFPVPEST